MTNAELAILSLVAEKPAYGYQIEKTIAERGMREWTDIGFSSIYYLLKKLESKNLVSSQLKDSPGGPARKVYHITPAGQAALFEEARQTLREPVSMPRPLLLGLSVVAARDPNTLYEELPHYLEAMTARQDELLSRRQAQQPLPPQAQVIFEYSLAMIAAEIAWVTRFLADSERFARPV